jgi:hypothetical protein
MNGFPYIPRPADLLPAINCTEKAMACGRTLSRDEFIFLAGARAALQREFDLAGERIGHLKLQRAIKELDQLRFDLAYRMGLIREALEAAPDYVRASVIGLGIFIEDSPQNPSRGAGPVSPSDEVFNGLSSPDSVRPAPANSISDSDTPPRARILCPPIGSRL